MPPTSPTGWTVRGMPPKGRSWESRSGISRAEAERIAREWHAAGYLEIEVIATPPAKHP